MPNIQAGDTTPWRALSPRDEAAVDACDGGAVLFGRDDLLAVVARGKHRTRFLHAITTQKLDQALEGVVTRNTLCTAKGALRGWWTQVVGADSDVLWTARHGAHTLVEELLAYRVAERVKLAVDDALALVEVIGPSAHRVVAEVLGVTLDEATREGLADAHEAPGAPAPTETPTTDKAATDNAATDNAATDNAATDNAAADASLTAVARRVAWTGADPCELVVWARALPQLGRAAGPLPRVTLQLPRASLGALAKALLHAGASAGSHAAREALRVRAGVPRLSTDLQEGSTPLELGLADAVHLNKGCYLGHEALAMQTWRGQLRRHLCWLAPTSDAALEPGVRLRTAAGKRGGQLGGGVTLPSGARLGLGLVQRRAYAPDALLSVPSGATLQLRGTTRAEVFSP